MLIGTKLTMHGHSSFRTFPAHILPSLALESPLTAHLPLFTIVSNTIITKQANNENIKQYTNNEAKTIKYKPGMYKGHNCK